MIVNYVEAEKIFADAKDILSQESWCKNPMFRGSGLCAWMAVKKASLNFFPVYTTPFCLAEIFCEVNDIKALSSQDMLSSIFFWNDEAKRTLPDVMQALDKCIAYCQVHQEKPVSLIQGKLEDVAIKKEFCNHDR